MLQYYVRNPETGRLVRADSRKGRLIRKNTGRYIEITDKQKGPKSPPTIQEYQQQCICFDIPQNSKQRKKLYMMDLSEQKDKVLKQSHQRGRKNHPK